MVVMVMMVMVLLMTSDPRHLGNGGDVIVSTPPVNAIMMPLQFSERRKLPESWGLYIRITGSERGLNSASVARFLSLRSGL